jgi:hypothetical protein
MAPIALYPDALLAQLTTAGVGDVGASFITIADRGAASGWVAIGRRSTVAIRGSLLIGAVRGMAGTGDIVGCISI